MEKKLTESVGRSGHSKNTYMYFSPDLLQMEQGMGSLGVKASGFRGFQYTQGLECCSRCVLKCLLEPVFMTLDGCVSLTAFLCFKC